MRSSMHVLFLCLHVEPQRLKSGACIDEGDVPVDLAGELQKSISKL